MGLEDVKIRAQTSVEYMIIIGFVTFAVIAILGLAYFYVYTLSDRIRTDQVGNYAQKIINTAEAVFYAGEPSKATVSAYLPKGVVKVELGPTDCSSNCDEIIFTVNTHSGQNTISFSSNVNIDSSSDIHKAGDNLGEGIKMIVVTAKTNNVNIDVS